MFASVGTTLKLHYWNKHNLETVATYKPKKTSFCQKIINISWSHDNSYILILREQNQPQIVSCRDRTNVNLIHTIQAVTNVTTATFENHTKRLLGLGNKEGTVVLYDTKNRVITKTVATLDSAISFLEFNLNDDQIAVATDNKLFIYFDNDHVNDFNKGIEIIEPISSLKFHPSMINFMAIGKKTGEVEIRDNIKCEIVSKLQKHSSAVTGITFFGSQKTLISTSNDHKICIYDYNSQENLFRINMHQTVTSVDISTNEPIFAAGLEDGQVNVYDIRQPLKPLVSAFVQDGPVNKLAFEKGSLCLHSLFERYSTTTLNDTEYSENQELNCMGDMEKCEKSDDAIKKEMLKMVKSHINYLENQLAEHCSKFQAFINNEFDAIHNALGRWDVFNIAEGSELEKLECECVKSTTTYPSNN